LSVDSVGSNTRDTGHGSGSRDIPVRGINIDGIGVTADGDSANKIGTYGVAVLAQAHRIPFYVLAPSSTFDLTLATGDAIPIEERGAEEITCGFGKRTAPEHVKVYAPAFDVTPARLITAIICERGILKPPFGKTIEKAVG